MVKKLGSITNREIICISSRQKKRKVVSSKNIGGGKQGCTGLLEKTLAPAPLLSWRPWQFLYWGAVILRPALQVHGWRHPQPSVQRAGFLSPCAVQTMCPAPFLCHTLVLQFCIPQWLLPGKPQCHGALAACLGDPVVAVGDTLIGSCSRYNT